jgi:integrase
MAKKKTSPRRASDDKVRLHLEEEEVTQLHKAAAKLGRNGHRDSTMILLAFHHGLRASEVAGLKWEHVNLDKENIYIRRCKGSKSGMHPLEADDVKALRKLGDESGYVFKSESKQRPTHVSESGFHKIVQRAGKQARLGSHVHPHMLRHACGFWLRKRRFDVIDIQEWLGHVNIQNTQHYAAAGPDHFRELGLGRKIPRR